MFSLALLGPLLASQARTDSTLVSTTLNVMQSFLSSAPLGSLQVCLSLHLSLSCADPRGGTEDAGCVTGWH